MITHPVRAAIFDFHGVISEPAWTALQLPSGAGERSLELLEQGKISFARYLSTLPYASPAGRSLRLTVRPQVVDAIGRLRQRGLAVALLTNSFRGFGGIRKNAGVPDDLFDVVVESWKVGIRKPDEGIYAVVLQELRLPPHECALIDDDENNVAAARRLGFQARTVADTTDVLAAIEAIRAAHG